jgi:lipopolysaccharide/colanic/teichoic acid biosynthesis glycosyltransferase
MRELSSGQRASQRHLQQRMPRPGTDRRGQEIAKRALDIVLSLAAILVAAPLLAALWLLVRLTSPGPGLFRQERLGRGMRTFALLKLRTMYIGTGDQLHRDYVASLMSGGQVQVTGPRGLLKLEIDPRTTRIGGWLRRTSLDELPQLFNVLRGDMSLVGPRPVLPWEAEMWPRAYPVYLRRFEVKPGITGLWQVSGRARLSVAESFELEADYVRRRSLGLDLLILARTLPSLLRGGTS